MAIFDNTLASSASSSRGVSGILGGTRNSNTSTDYYNLLRDITNSNNALSMQIANNQMGFQSYQADLNR